MNPTNLVESHCEIVALFISRILSITVRLLKLETIINCRFRTLKENLLNQWGDPFYNLFLCFMEFLGHQ